MFPFNRTKTIKWHEFFKISEYDRVTYKVVPHREISNKENTTIARAVQELYGPPLNRIKLNIKNVQVTYRLPEKFSFDIYFTPESTNFYISFPAHREQFMLTKISSVWEHATILKATNEEVKSLNHFEIAKTVAATVKYSKHNIFSFNTEKDNLHPLNSMFSVHNDLKEGDKCRVNICVEPINRFSWQTEADHYFKELNKGQMPSRNSLDKETALKYFVRVNDWVFTAFTKFMEEIMDIFDLSKFFTNENSILAEKIDKLANSIDKQAQELKYSGGVSTHTRHKLTAPACNTDITVFSQSNDRERGLTNLRTIAVSYNDLNGDNEFKYKILSESKAKQKIDELQHNKNKKWGIDRCVCSDTEVAKLIQLPQITLQVNFPTVEKVDTIEINIPEALTDPSGVQIGESVYRGKVYPIYLSPKRDNITLPFIIPGLQGMGKTSLLESLAREFVVKRGETVILIDDIKKCEMSTNVLNHLPRDFPEDKIVILNFDDLNRIIPLSYNEIYKCTKGKRVPIRKLRRIAGQVGEQLVFLINTAFTNDKSQELTIKMLDYLKFGSNVIFSLQNKTIKDLYDILRDHRKRAAFLKEVVDLGIYTEDEDTIMVLKELDETNNKGIVTGTRLNEVKGVLDRLNGLLTNNTLSDCLTVPPNDSIDFIKWTEEGGYLILIRLPEHAFSKREKDVIMTMLMSKIWLSTLVKGEFIDKPKIFHVISDEIHQHPQAVRTLEHIKEARKFGCHYIFSTHDIESFNEALDYIRSAGCHYFLFKTTDKNYKLLRNDLAPYNYETLSQETKQYHALCSLICDAQRYNILVDMIKPLDKRYKEINREHLINISMDKYAIKLDDDRFITFG